MVFEEAEDEHGGAYFEFVGVLILVGFAEEEMSPRALKEAFFAADLATVARASDGKARRIAKEMLRPAEPQEKA